MAVIATLQGEQVGQSLIDNFPQWGCNARRMLARYTHTLAANAANGDTFIINERVPSNEIWVFTGLFDNYSTSGGTPTFSSMNIRIDRLLNQIKTVNSAGQTVKGTDTESILYDGTPFILQKTSDTAVGTVYPSTDLGWKRRAVDPGAKIVTTLTVKVTTPGTDWGAASVIRVTFEILRFPFVTELDKFYYALFTSALQRAPF